MELIDRYLQAVKFWLPKQQKDDIIAELSEDLRAQMEEQESGLGRKLTEAEVGALLKQRGRPVLVANRYLPQEYLIGPVLFPIYLFVLRIVGLCYLVPWVIVWTCVRLYSPGLQGAQDAHSWSSAVGSFWSSLWLTAFVTAGIVTIVFAVLEQAQTRSRFLENWDPGKLPPVRNPNQIPRTDSIIELVVNLLFFSWWAGNMTSSIMLNHPDVRIVLAPVWSYFFWGFLLIALVNASLAAVNLMRPYATRSRAAIRLVSDLAGSALFCWLLKAGVFVGFAPANASAARSIEIANSINWWAAKMFPAAVVVCAVIAVFNVFKLVRAKPASARAACQATAMTA